jgi:hypothetical protein
MDQDASTMTQVVWTVYDWLAPAVIAAIGYASVFLTGVVRKRVKNDLASGLLARLTHSVCDAVAAVAQRQHELTARARGPNSPGGKKLTLAEAELLRKAAMQMVKDYWGPKGLKLLASVLAEGERDQDRAAVQVDRVITAKIEAEVDARKRREWSSLVTKPPGVHRQPM